MVSSFDRAPSPPSVAPSVDLLLGVATAISKLSTEDDYPTAITTALSQLGQCLRVRRVEVCEMPPAADGGVPAIAPHFAWSQDGVTPPALTPELPIADVAIAGWNPWYNALETRQPLVATVPNSSPHRSDLPPPSPLTLWIVPIAVGDCPWGILALEPGDESRLWSDAEQTLLQLMATSLGGAIARYQAETALRHNEERYRAMLDAMPDLIFRIRRDGTYLDCKAEPNTDILLPPEQLIGKTIYDVLPTQVAEQRMTYIRKALDTREVQQFEYQLQFQRHPLARQIYRGISPELDSLSEGTTFWREYEARVVASGADEVLAIVRDITDRQQSDTALRLSEEKFSKAFRSSPNPMTIATLQEGRLIEVNDSFVEAIDYPKEQVVGQTVHDIQFWNFPADRDRFIQQLQEQGSVRNMEILFRRRSGEVRMGLISGEIIQIGDEPCLLDCIVDITEQQQANQHLWAAAERDRLLGEIALRIRQSLDLQEILNTTVDEVRRFLAADRVIVTQFDESNEGLAAESLAPGIPSLGDIRLEDEQTREVKQMYEGYCTNVVNDVTEVQASSSLKEICDRYQIRAAIDVPLEIEDQLYGALIVHQAQPRQWQPIEVHLMERLATQVAIAISQASLYRRVQSLNAGLEQQVAERTSQLQQKMEELQALNDLKDEFLNAFSHDLKTPIMGTSLVLNNLLNQPGDLLSIPRSVLEGMAQSSNRQLDLITALLQAHSAESNELTLNYALLNLGTLVDDVAHSVEPLIRRSQATLTNDVPLTLPPINGDSVQLCRVFENLITNALNHNPPGIHIHLQAHLEQDRLRVLVQDNGTGIVPNLRDRLFERYTRGSRSRHSTGVGLGLYLCRQIVTAHGGQIGVESTINEGSTFWLTLPIAIVTP